MNKFFDKLPDTFIIFDTEISKDYGWIKEISIENDSIFNEEKTNILIHF